MYETHTPKKIKRIFIFIISFIIIIIIIIKKYAHKITNMMLLIIFQVP
jgi:hypothetical protein